jgi:hypothetical protein
LYVDGQALFQTSAQGLFLLISKETNSNSYIITKFKIKPTPKYEILRTCGFHV